MPLENADVVRYIAQSDQFLGQAWNEFRQGDLRQASEKGWGAVTQSLKALAEAGQRGKLSDHGQYRRFVTQVSLEVEDRELGILFREAESLHANFYEGHLSSSHVGTSLARMDVLVTRIKTLLDRTRWARPDSQ